MQPTRRRSEMVQTSSSAPGAAGRAPAADQPGVRAQRGAGRPLRGGQDHAGRGAARRDRHDPPGRPGRGRHHGQRLRRGRGPPAALGRRSPLAPLDARRASRSTCSTPPATPTSSATCAPACAPPTPRCSSSRPSTASTAPPRMLWEECAAVGMPRAVVVTKLDQAAGRLRRGRRRSASGSSATACCRCTCRWHADDGSAGRPDRAALAAGLRLLRRHAGSSATPDAEHLPLIEDARNALIEGIIAESRGRDA